MKDFFKFILKLFLKALLPAFLIYFSKTTFISDILIKNDFIVSEANVSGYKFWAFLIGTVIAGIILPIELYITKKKLKKQKRLIRAQVDIILAQIAHDLELVSGDLFIRVFKVKKWFYSSKVQLIDFHLEDITVRINGKKKLVFEVDNGIAEGVVGKSFFEQSFLVDYNISQDANSYALSAEHISRIGEVKFCCAAPIVYSKKKIKYVISIDSDKSTRKSVAKTKLLRRNLVYLSQLFDEFIL
jgi:hypothetical protein